MRFHSSSIGVLRGRGGGALAGALPLLDQHHQVQLCGAQEKVGERESARVQPDTVVCHTG